MAFVVKWFPSGNDGEDFEQIFCLECIITLYVFPSGNIKQSEE